MLTGCEDGICAKQGTHDFGLECVDRVTQSKLTGSVISPRPYRASLRKSQGVKVAGSEL
jgi:hypothetical protein